MASCNSLRSVLDLSLTSSGEIFVLETGRSVIRLATAEDDLAPASDWRRGQTVAQGADTELESALLEVGTRLVERLPRLPVLQSLAANLSSELQSMASKVRGQARTTSPAEEVMEAVIGLNYSNTTQSSCQLSPPASELLDSDFKARMDLIGDSEFTEEIAQRSPRRTRLRYLKSAVRRRSGS